MILLTREQTASIRNRFQPERPGSLIGPHIIQTGNGKCYVDRWPAPRALLADVADNYHLLGVGQALTPADVQPLIEGFVQTSESFVPLLRLSFPDVKVWQRIIFAQPDAPDMEIGSDYRVRRLEAGDSHSLEGLDPGSAWITKTWGGPGCLAQSGYGWGAFMEGQLASVACTFFLGETYEEIAVATEPRFCGLGLSTACARGLCNDIQARGHQPSWTTSPDNLASQRIAEKLGFTLQRTDVFYVVGIEIPEPAPPPGNE